MSKDFPNIQSEKCPRCGNLLKWGKDRQGWYMECDLCGYAIEGDYDPMDEGEEMEVQNES